MSYAKVGDSIIPELLLEALPGAFAKVAVMRSTGVANFVMGMPAGRAELGSEIRIPYFGTIGDLEELTEDGQALTPVGLGMTAETAKVRHAGKAIEATYWARAASLSDPYAEMARQVAVAIERFADQELITAATATNPAGSILTLDVYNAGTPRTLDWDLIVDGKMQWGDEQDDIGAIVVHSKVKGDLYKLKDSTGRPLFVDGTDGQLDRMAGIPVIVSDRMPVSGENPKRYTTLLLKKNSLLFWVGAQHADTDKDVLAGSEVAAWHIYFAVHRYSRFPNGTKPGIVRITHN